MEQRPRIHGFFSQTPRKEKLARWVSFGVLVVVTAVLAVFWRPLRNPELTYPFVAVTIGRPWAIAVLRVITTLGSEGFFLTAFSVLYWSGYKRQAYWGMLLMPAAIFFTSEVPKDILRLPRPDIRGIAVPTYTFPSGHTSGAISVWGYAAIIVGRRWLWIFGAAITLLVGVSRVMLGYHFPGDVLGGFVSGAIFLTLFLWWAPELAQKTVSAKPSFSMRLTLAIGIPFVLSLIPASFAARMMGYIAGAAVGYTLENEFLDFRIRGVRRYFLFRAVIGLLVLAVLVLGLEYVLTSRYHLLTFAHFSLVTLWSTYLAPLLFLRLGLVQRAEKVRTGYRR